MRPTRDQWALELAVVTAKRTTCHRRAVGCVLLDEHGHVLSTGYNGVAAGQPHCAESVEDRQQRSQLCPGANEPSGTGLDRCLAIHAEQNALLQCRDVHQIVTCYVTVAPCITCTKLLLNTGCQRIVYLTDYAHPEARELWLAAQRRWEQVMIYKELKFGELL